MAGNIYILYIKCLALKRITKINELQVTHGIFSSFIVFLYSPPFKRGELGYLFTNSVSLEYSIAYFVLVENGHL